MNERWTRLLGGAQIVLTLAFSSGCGGTAPKAEEVGVFAAASAKEACDRIIALADPSPVGSGAEAARPSTGESNTIAGAAIIANYAGSDVLARQIKAGAPADIFLSASQSWADDLEKAGLVARRVDLLSNELVIVVSKGNPAKVARPEDLTKPAVTRIALADPSSVPAGVYAKEAFTKLKLWAGIEPKVVAGDSVRWALTTVARGEIPVGVVYATDARPGVAAGGGQANPSGVSGVEVVFTFPPETHSPIRYPLVLLRRAADRSAALALYDRFQSPSAAAIFRELGFVWLPPAGSQR